ncbi:hypothetical protein [Streptomyces sp. NPDC048277]|uniref:hypothetical protein n=1 Tax=Streptomyces sp. NPDC048277 TaxID=3155027 RepID=UPI00340AECC1
MPDAVGHRKEPAGLTPRARLREQWLELGGEFGILDDRRTPGAVPGEADRPGGG